MNLTVIIPFYNGNKTLPRLLGSLPSGLDVVLVDDHSNSPPILDGFPAVRLIRPPQKGYFSGAVNSGLALIPPDQDVLILNQDVYFNGDSAFTWLEERRSNFALIGEKIAPGHPAYPLGYIQGTFMFIRADARATVGLLNASDYPLWGATCEYQLRTARAGFSIHASRSIPGFIHERHGNFGSAIRLRS